MAMPSAVSRAARAHLARILRRTRARRLSNIPSPPGSTPPKLDPTPAAQGGSGGLGIVGHVLALALGAAGATFYLSQKPKAPNEKKSTEKLMKVVVEEKKVVEATKTKIPDVGGPPAESVRDLMSKMLEAYMKIVKEDDVKEIGKYGGDVKESESNSSPPTPTSMKEAIELIEVLHALNRGLLVQLTEEQQDSSAFKEKIFRQMEPVFLKEASRMIQAMEKKIEKKNQDDLADLENEFVKRVVIQLEMQKQSLFSEYKDRADKLAQEYSAKLKGGLDEKQSEYDRRVADLDSLHKAEREARIQTLKRLSERSSALGHMLDHAIQAQGRGKQVWEMSLRLLETKEAMKGESSFASEWKALLDASKGDSIIETAICSVPPKIPVNGVPTRSQLKDRYFDSVERAVREAALVEQSKSSESNIWGFALARVFSRLLIPQRIVVEGTGPQEILSRAGYHVYCGDMEEAVKELESLSGEPAEVSKDWIQDVKDRLLLEQTLRVIKARMSHLDSVHVTKSN